MSLASELNCSGVDIDYEEFWHADTFKTVAQGGTAAAGPWELHQTSFKLAAILKDVADGIDALSPGLKMSTAAPAVGAWQGKWWGGNLKGTLLEVRTGPCRWPSTPPTARLPSPPPRERWPPAHLVLPSYSA